ncbi:hypothetical protein O3Q52_11750 [Streptomyces sp. ActVer]|uniref:hypothetical protein n=1 Tax=Streptomyces sp. ActVer TaxID=3014558 RepID=UPI0022B35B2E|nr:hypothetical protein [Streptomyces sp. ActVer]MCZ4508866.1 hypothetical protein [Streptomyces sp. ActVer]
MSKETARWLAFSLTCALGSAGLGWLAPALPLKSWVGGAAVLTAWLLLPLATVLVPMLGLRRVPRARRKMAWQLIVPVVAGVALGVVAGEAGQQSALAERGRWTTATVVGIEDAKTDQCTLQRRADGTRISPRLSEGDGCRSVSKGDILRVRYDPEGAAGPVTDVESDSYGGLIAGLVLAAVAMGTWGSVRMSRWDHAYAAS